MKHIFVIVVFSLVCLGLSAQTGWFNISFDQDRGETLAILAEQGFKIEEDKQERMSFSGSTYKGFLSLELWFNAEDRVSSWSIIYDAKASEEFVDDLLDEMDEMSGFQAIWDENNDTWVWELENHKGAYLYELPGDKIRIEYGEFDDSVYDEWY